MDELPSGLTWEEADKYLTEHYPAAILDDDPDWVREMMDALMDDKSL